MFRMELSSARRLLLLRRIERHYISCLICVCIFRRTNRNWNKYTRMFVSLSKRMRRKETHTHSCCYCSVQCRAVCNLLMKSIICSVFICCYVILFAHTFEKRCEEQKYRQMKTNACAHSIEFVLIGYL